MRFILAFIFALILTATPAPAAAVDVDALLERAQNGDVAAQFTLGGVYWQGRHVAQNYDKAFKWFLAAAKQGVPEAQANIANFYLNGWSVEQDQKKALFWHRKAAAQNFALSQFWIGQFYRGGLGGVAQNRKKAIQWMTKAANQNFAEAQSVLGVLAFQDKKFKEARAWFLKAAEGDNPSAQFMIAQLYQKGVGGEQDIEEAASWFESAVDNGVVEAKFQLGGLLYKGHEGVPKDEARAFELFQEAAEQNYVLAQHNAGVMLVEGIGTQKDVTAGLALLDKAAKRGHVKALLYLSSKFSKGKDVKQDYQRAYEYLLVIEGLKIKDEKGKLAAVLKKTKKPVARALSEEQKEAAKTRAQEMLAAIKTP